MKFAMLFPGQGAQYVGMGKALYETYDWVKEIYQDIKDRFALDIYKLSCESDLEYLTRTDHAQIVIFVVSYINYLAFLNEFTIRPDYMAGHSLGEFTALTASGALAFEESFELVLERGRLMQIEAEKSQGGMLAVKAGNEKVKLICKEFMEQHNSKVCISNYNSANQIVLSGDTDTLNIIEKTFESNGILTTRLNVGAAFHSSYMNMASCEFSSLLSKKNFLVPKCKVISNVSSLPYGEDIYSLLSRQMVSAVRWHETIKYLEREGVDIYIDIGPKSILKGMMKRSLNKGHVYSYEDEEDKALLHGIFNKQEQS